jgi:hypothetical protein
MASTAEGITVGDEGIVHDPNDAAGFEAIMAARGVTEARAKSALPTAASRRAASPLPGRSRARRATRRPGSSSRTRRRLPPRPHPPLPPTPRARAKATSQTPQSQEFLSKYDGNVEEALKGAANAQALIGRRDERTETLEKELAELRGITHGLMARGAAPAAQPLSNEQVVDIASTRIEAQGYEGAATRPRTRRTRRDDERHYQAVLEQWDLESGSPR